MDASNISQMLSNSQFDEVCDETLINILDSLHNETTVGENISDEEDEDSALSYESIYKVLSVSILLLIV